jgi:uncharacterized protein (UPF0212 family)
MVSTKNPNVNIKLSEYEINLLNQAADDFYEKGETDLKCPRCGNDFEFHSTASSYSIKCKTYNCIKDTCRGI